ncbi:tripartite tricarboxylate transporter substrate binding protein [Pigmentiphaga sp. GD03639]|uniref:Bug family tripartite tricarboxylate transporter substrate binding protein n=1 Tax=Pigmentiphaga sp. GD03639 TaxID=2975354 RepID=UPI002447CDAE|nr:tripartite tricarboxylate transporter substrate binding protein [Pigmentiphaga sp. GD03639]MDH2237183.1 tripartite tricarboxylate transporter substrate binding protein [Pigmentiphaga sp. GD03639]
MHRHPLMPAAWIAAAFACVLPPLASAQDIPRKSITMVVGFAPGGGADTAARLIARKLADNLGRPVVVENKAGAGGNIAHDLVARAEPDGSTILLGSIGPLAIAPHLMKLPYDPVKDLAPITMGVNFPNVLVAYAGLGVKTLNDYIEMARKHPEKMSYASTGAGSASHLAGELLNQRAGVNVVHVPYKGGAPAMVDLLSGRVASYYSTPSSAQPHIETGKVVAIATTGLKRPAFMPDVPTIAESGIPGFNATNWYAFVAPGRTPAGILDRWNEEILKVLKDPDVSAQLIKHGLTPDPMSREELARFIADESATWGAIIEERHITAQ